MKIFETATSFDLDDDAVWVAGDWHGNAGWAGTAIRAMGRFGAVAKTVLQLGDFWPTKHLLISIDKAAREAGIERLLFIPGNHEPWPQLMQIEEDLAPGSAARISETVWFLPRPFRFTIGGRTVLALGGASSVDAGRRTHGVDWWPEEEISEAHELAAISGGRADVFLSHESPVSVVPQVAKILASNPHGFPREALELSRLQRECVERVRDGVQPRLHLHGHMHVYGARILDNGSRVVSLNRDAHEGNLVLVDLGDLSFEILPMTSIREA